MLGTLLNWSHFLSLLSGGVLEVTQSQKMVARAKWGQVRKRCRKSRLRWSWLGARPVQKVEVTVEEAQIQPWWWSQFQSGHNSDNGGFPSSWSQERMYERRNIGDDNGDYSTFSTQAGVFSSSWSQERMDERKNVGDANGDYSTFSAQAGVGSSNNNNQRARGSETFLQVAQQGFIDAEVILEQNRMLIQEISQNKENRETDGLTRNAELIRRLNTNIAYAFDLYSYLSGSFSDYVIAKNATNADEPSVSDLANP